MLSHLAQLRQSSRPAPERCACFILLHLWRRHGDQWLSGPRPSGQVPSGEGQVVEQLTALGFQLKLRQRTRLEGLASLEELWEHFFFRGIVRDAHEGLLGWMKGHYPLQLRLDVPSPDAMLATQAFGARYVSLLLQDEDQFRRHGRHSDAGDFLLHDFEHAQKFFGDADSFLGQRRFFAKLKDSLSRFERWCADLKFAAALDYLKADMNSHPVHLLKYLKAIVLTAEMELSGNRWPDLDSFWRGLFEDWGLSPEAQRSALNLNHPGLERSEDQLAVRDFFTLPQKPLARDAAEAR